VAAAPLKQENHAGSEAQPEASSTYDGQRFVKDPPLGAR
jgi:hypothetical protein